MHRYVPPRFDLFEFDDDPFGPGQQGQRQFIHWNGLVSKHAEEVTLAWSAGDAAVLVATSQRSYDPASARLSAAHLALGGNALPIPARPGSVEDVVQEIQRIASTDGLWSPGPAMAPGGSSADVAVCGGFSLAYGHVGSEMVLVAAVGVRPAQFRVRKVRDWGTYDIDATKSHPMSELNWIIESMRG